MNNPQGFIVCIITGQKFKRSNRTALISNTMRYGTCKTLLRIIQYGFALCRVTTGLKRRAKQAKRRAPTQLWSDARTVALNGIRTTWYLSHCLLCANNRA